MPSRHRTPDPARPLIGMGLAAGLTAAALLAAPLPLPPARLEGLEPWWRSVGTAEATASIIRMLGVTLAGWTVTVSAVGVIAAATRRGAAIRLWRLVAPAQLRRAVVVSAVVAGVSTPAAVLGADPSDAPPVLRDLGRAETTEDAPPPVLIDLGPIDDVPAAGPAVEPLAADAASRADVWIVERGDHLWSVAAETLADRGGATTDAAVADYWQQLIDLNQGAIGPDPDLIHPGAVLTLP